MQLFDTRDVCQIIGIKRVMLYRHVTKGTLVPLDRVGRDLFFDKAAIKNFQKKRRKVGRPPKTKGGERV